MAVDEVIVRNALPGEYREAGEKLVNVYSHLEGFPGVSEQPGYYRMLADVGKLTENPATELIVAVAPGGKLAGGVVFFGDMQYYGSGGTATKERNAAGFRLLFVDKHFRGQGIGKLLTLECIRRAREKNLGQVIIHTTKSMQNAWLMYEKLGFRRSVDLDFMQGKLEVFGFRLML